MTPMPVSVRIAYTLYLLTASAATVFVLLWMTSPGFRYWLFARSREIQYRWAMWEYSMRHEPVPAWVERIRDGAELPDES